MIRFLALLFLLLGAAADAQVATPFVPSTVVTGPASATSGNCASFNGTTGKIVQDSGTTCGGGALTLISTQTANNSADIRWTGLSGYNSYMLIVSGLEPVTSADSILLQYGEGSTPTWETSNYQVGGQRVRIDTATATVYANISASGIGMAADGGVFSGTANGISGWFIITNLPSSSVQKSTTGTTFWKASATVYQSAALGGQYTGDTNAITALRLIGSTSNLSSGTASLYGINQ